MKVKIALVLVLASILGLLGAALAFLGGAVLCLFSHSMEECQLGSWALGGLGTGLGVGMIIGVTWLALGWIAAYCGAVGLALGAWIALPPRRLFYWNVFGGLAIGVTVGVIAEVIRKRWLPPMKAGVLVPIGFFSGGVVGCAISYVVAYGLGAGVGLPLWVPLAGSVGALIGGSLGAILEARKTHALGEASD